MNGGHPARRAAIAGAMLILTLSALSACDGGGSDEDGEADVRRQSAADFPRADRPVAPVVSIRYASEEARDRVHEAREIMDKAGIRPGMSVADVGAGEGYYTVRLARRVGPNGRVQAEDILAEVVDALEQRVSREGLANVRVTLGAPDDPKLPAGRFDRILMAHMYHEVEEPYAFLWNLWPALRPGGQVVVVDSMRSTDEHGTPPKMLICEFAAVGYQLVELEAKPAAGGYIARFRTVGARPAPDSITPCEEKGE